MDRTLNSLMEDPILRLRKAYSSAHHLVFFCGIRKDPAVKAWLELIKIVADARARTIAEEEALADAYAGFFSALSQWSVAGNEEQIGTPWQNHLLDLVLRDENPFSNCAERVHLKHMGESWIEQAKLDLNRLKQIYDLDSSTLLEAIKRISGETAWVTWEQLHPTPPAGPCQGNARVSLKKRLHVSENWGQELAFLVDYYQGSGIGIFGQFRAFHWEGSATGGRLRGIPEPDPIQLEDLIGCNDQKDWLVQNTRFFLEGLPANNILVYGDRGTGKSSSIKALVHHFSNQRLHLVEISRDDLHDLPQVMNILRRRTGRFILFIDDLSFEEAETQYKTLKAVLEGSLEARPGNVLIYATSNRRHLIREYFSDRSSVNDEVRHQDTLQEKISLADRFGIQLVFVAPNQAQYLDIVRSMALRRRLEVPDKELSLRALQWAELHNGRSGRTARQFIDFLAGELRQGARDLGLEARGSSLEVRQSKIEN